MNTFKQLKNGNVKINGIEHKVYTISDIPNRFGFYWDKEREIDGIGDWYCNHKAGLVYIAKK